MNTVVLILISAVPIIAGIYRITNFQVERPLLIHIIFASLYLIFGALLFFPKWRINKLNWHRFIGMHVFFFGVITATSGIWLTLFYPAGKHDGSAVFVMRLVVGFLMISFLLLGITSIGQGRSFDHGKWMKRSYALALGAGTQAITHIPWFLFPTIQGETARAIFMGAGWVINIIVVELFLLQHKMTCTTRSMECICRQELKPLASLESKEQKFLTIRKFWY